MCVINYLPTLLLMLPVKIITMSAVVLIGVLLSIDLHQPTSLIKFNRWTGWDGNLAADRRLSSV